MTSKHTASTIFFFKAIFMNWKTTLIDTKSDRQAAEVEFRVWQQFLEREGAGMENSWHTFSLYRAPNVKL